MPQLHINRAYLSFSINSVSSCYKNDLLLKYADLLVTNVKVDIIFNSEFKNKSLFPRNGLSGAMFLLNKLSQKEITKIDGSNTLQGISNIYNSELIKELISKEKIALPSLGLINGLAGVLLFSGMLENKMEPILT